MGKVKFKKIISATVAADNSDDESAKWNISANVVVNNDNIDGFNEGEVKDKGGALLASFSTSGKQYLNVSYYQADSGDEQEILSSIREFTEDVDESGIGSLIKL